MADAERTEGSSSGSGSSTSGEGLTGMLVTEVAKTGPSAGIIELDDVVLGIDGHEIANDGTVAFREHERIAFQYFTSLKAPGESVEMRVLRKGKVMTLPVPVAPLDALVPSHFYRWSAVAPPYLIYSGLVFVPLSKTYLYSFGNDWYNVAPRYLVSLLDELPEEQGEQVVIVAQVLADAENAGYGHKSDERVVAVNGTKVKNLAHLAELMTSSSNSTSSSSGDDDDNTKRFLRLDLHDKSPIIIDTTAAEQATERVLRRYRISDAMSEGLRPQQAGGKE